MLALLVVIAARLGFAALAFARPELALQNDTDRYVPIARNILSGHAYAWNTSRPGELLNTVGYPLFLAGVYLIAGSAPGDVAAAQLLLSGALVVALFLGLRASVGDAPALFAAMILAVDPLTILWSLTILTETLFAVCLGLAAVLLVRWSTTTKWWTLALSGFCLGMACLVKPYALLLVLVWAAAILLRPSPGGAGHLKQLRAGMLGAAMLLIPVLALTVPWVLRNAILWNCPTLSSVDRVTMRDYVAAKVIGEYENIPLEDAQAQLQQTYPGVCPGGSAEYVEIIVSHPEIYARLHVAGTIPVVLGTSSDRWLEFFGSSYALPDLWRPFMDGGVAAVASVLGQQLIQFPGAMFVMAGLVLWQLLMYVAALAGLLAYRRADTMAIRWNIIVIGLSILVLVLTPGQGGHERFRVPVQPLLAILAAYGVAWGAVGSSKLRRALLSGSRASES